MKHQNPLGQPSTPEDAAAEKPISSERIPHVRRAIQNRRLSFPAQVPAFASQSRQDVQWRMAALYFLQGWSCVQIAQRYGLTQGRIRQLIRKWLEKAAAMGYLQRIPLEAPMAIGKDRSQTAVSIYTNATKASGQHSADWPHKNT